MNKEAIETGKAVMDTGRGPRLRKRATTPSSDDPREELRRLVMQHKALTKNAVALTNMVTDKKALQDIVRDGVVVFKKGDAIKSRIPSDVQEQAKTFAKEVFAREADKIKGQMLRELRKIPVFQLFLSRVFGVGPVIAAYLVAEIDIRRSIKPSALRRFCGLAVIDGRLERRQKGEKAKFSTEMRTRLYQAFTAMAKNAVLHGKTTKYMEIWEGARHRKLQMADAAGKVVNGQGREVSAKGYAYSYGWHKAADVLIEDLYVVWRAIEGLEVWPSYYAAKLGYEHGGKISVNAPKLLTVEEALATVDVASVEGRAYTWPKKGEHEEELDAAAE